MYTFQLIFGTPSLTYTHTQLSYCKCHFESLSCTHSLTNQVSVYEARLFEKLHGSTNLYGHVEDNVCLLY